MSSRIVLHGGDVVMYEGMMHDGVVTVRDGVIGDICFASEHSAEENDRVIDCDGFFVCPGFIDIHNQGGGGYTVMDGSEEHTFGMCRVHAEHGTTGLLLTPLIEAERYRSLIPVLAGMVGKNTGGASILGIHAEGPFVNPDRKGCMPDNVILEPDSDVLKDLLDLGVGTITEMTIAPELPGSLDIILELSRNGVIPSLGHSNAKLDDVLRAIDCGASHVTHYFNAMSPLNHREPGLAGTALYSIDLTVEVIADGFHIHPWVLGLVVQNKGIGRTCLITDAMPTLGMEDGTYESMGQAVSLENGRLSLADDPAILAGSVLTQDRAVANMVQMVGFSVTDAVTMASATPAAVLGLDTRKGRLAPGFDADIAVLDQRYLNRLTLVGGEVVFNTMDS